MVGVGAAAVMFVFGKGGSDMLAGSIMAMRPAVNRVIGGSTPSPPAFKG